MSRMNLIGTKVLASTRNITLHSNRSGIGMKTGTTRIITAISRTIRRAYIIRSESRLSQLILGLIVTLLLANSMVLSIQTPLTSSIISEGASEGFGPLDSIIPSYVFHDPIIITSNADFASLGFSGSGTLGDPYVIAGYSITNTDPCISIQDTDVYFIIRDCLFIGRYGNTVELYSVNHGEIRNNTISDGGYGLHLESSSDNTIANNTITGNSYRGVYLESSSNNTVVNNTISDGGYGLHLEFSSDNIIANNNISENNYGVYLYYSSDNTLLSNIFVNNGISIVGDEVGHWRHTITTDNLLNEKQLGYFWNLTSGIIDGAQYDQVILANCTGVVVENGAFSNSSVGIQMGYSSYCNLVNNTISGSSIAGVYLSSSAYNTIVNTTISSNFYSGLYLDFFSVYNSIVNNTIAGCNNGVYLSYSAYNTVMNNILSENTNGVYVYYSSDCVLINNSISENAEYGLLLRGSSDTVVSSNIFVNNGISIPVQELDFWRQNITTDNIVNGKMLGYFWDLTNGVIDGTQYGQVILAKCTGVTVENGVFMNSSVGIQLGFSSFCILLNNTISGGCYGIYLMDTSYSTIMNNTVSKTLHRGVFLYHRTNNNVLENNTIWGNYYGGMELNTALHNIIVNNVFIGNYYGLSISGLSFYNLIYLNRFADNIVNAYCTDADNHFNITGLGNYWSDYNGTGVYQLPGPIGAIDYHPFIYPPSETSTPTIDQPADLIYREGTNGNNITWFPSDAHPYHYMVFENGTQKISSSWNGSSIIVEVDNLNVGVYVYRIVVYDTSGNWVSDIVFVIVVPQTSTTSTTTTTPSPTTSELLLISIVSGIGLFTVVILLIMYRRGRKTGFYSDYEGSGY